MTKNADRVDCESSSVLEVVTFCPVTKGSFPRLAGVAEKCQEPLPVRRASLANLNAAQNALLSNSPLLSFQFSETTAEFQIMKKELEELKSVNRRRK